MQRRWRLAAGLAAVCVVALSLAAATTAQEKVAITMATGPTGGVYALLGGGMATILSKDVPGYAVNAESTAASLVGGESSCEDIGDSSAYWVPTLFAGGRALRPLVGVGA